MRCKHLDYIYTAFEGYLGVFPIDINRQRSCLVEKSNIVGIVWTMLCYLDRDISIKSFFPVCR
jgi:hypothetical protein